MTPRHVAAWIAAVCSLGALPAHAQYQGIVSLPPVGPGDSRLLLGGSAIVRPAYLGSDDRVWTVLPYIDYANRNGFFASTGSGIGYSFVNTATTQVGVRMIPRFGRRESQSADLRGMGDIGFGVEASVYWTQALSRVWTVGLNLRGGDKGGELDAGVRRDFQLAPTTRLSVTGFVTAANGTSQQSWFGVDAGLALASGYAPYAPSSGLRNAQLAISANHFFAGRWIAIGGVGLGRVLGDAADSPIVRDRSTATAFAAIGYQLF
jgi:outer membrane scaffolding protein for murein synthesis (MipA/OmpV family)